MKEAPLVDHWVANSVDLSDNLMAVMKAALLAVWTVVVKALQMVEQMAEWLAERMGQMKVG